MLFAALPLAAAAQNAVPYKGAVSVGIAESEKYNGEVMFRANIDFSSLKLSTETMLTLTPVVRSASRQAEYPPVVILTPQRERVNKRDERSGIRPWETEPSEVIVLKKNTPRFTEVSLSVPYEDWLDQAELVIVETASDGDNILREYAPGVYSHIYTKRDNRIAPAYAATARTQNIPAVSGNGATAYRPQFRVASLTESAGQAHRESYRITFGQKNTLINRTVGDNAVVLARSDEKIREILATPHMEITNITITGFASPEGETDDNGALAADRARTLANYLSNVHSLRSPAVKVLTSGGEDWNGLRKLVENSTLDNRYMILDALDNYSNIYERKNALMELNEGAAYAVLLNYFSALRRVEYTIEYTVKSSASQPGFNDAAARLEAGAYDSAIRYFERQTGPEAWNNLGVAYWHTGDYGRSLDCLHKAADAGSEEAKENIRQFTLWKENRDN